MKILKIRLRRADGGRWESGKLGKWGLSPARRLAFSPAFWLVLALAVSTSLLVAQVTKKFPAHWGGPPPIQTQDIVELPGGYGYGSSTAAKWIAENMEKDKRRQESATSPEAKPLYENDFEEAEVGSTPDEFLVLLGDFTVKEVDGNTVLELPGAPLDSFGLLFGPTEVSNVTVAARIFSTARGRLFPTFGVGLNGVNGYRLQVSPGKKALEIYRGDEVVASIPREWTSGEWLHFRLQVRQVRDGEWKVEGKVWPQDDAEPAEWMVAFDEKQNPIPGRASIWGSPFSGRPIQFDDLRVERVVGAQ